MAAPQAAPYPYDQTFLLHSLPGANRTIFLDFDGHTVSNTGWNHNSGLAERFYAERELVKVMAWRERAGR